MQTTRRGLILGGAALILAPAIVRASSLDFIPRHRYFAMVPVSAGHCFDIVRDDGHLIGWLGTQDLRRMGTISTQEILGVASDGFSIQHRNLFAAELAGAAECGEEAHSRVMPLSELLRV